MIVQIFDKSPFTEKIDALSRVKIFGSNAINSPEIIRFGNVTKFHDEEITYKNGREAIIPSFDNGHEVVERFYDGSRALIFNDEPCPIAQVLSEINDMDILENSLYLSQKLKLDKKNPDLIDGYWKRCFCDPGEYSSGSVVPLDFYKNDGVFDCREEMFIRDNYATIMEIKYFKTVHIPKILRLYFKPNRSRLWDSQYPRPNAKILISSELGVVLANQYEIIWWFQNCNDLDRMDFSSLQGHDVTFLVMDFAYDSKRSHNSFAEALAFKAAALRQSISVSITTFLLEHGKNTLNIPAISHARNIAGNEFVHSSQKVLNEGEFLQKCDSFKLKIDPILRGNPYELKFGRGEAVIEELLPFFFNRRQLTLFQEPATPSIRNILLKLLNGTKAFAGHPATITQTLMFCPRGNVHRIKKQLRNEKGSTLKVYEDTALLALGLNPIDEMKTLLEETRSELVLLELSGYSDTQAKSLQDAVDFCLDRGISVGIFCEDGKASPALTDMVDRNLIVGMADTNTYIIKEKMEGGPSAIRKFNFESEVVSVEESNEEELADAMKNNHKVSLVYENQQRNLQFA